MILCWLGIHDFQRHSNNDYGAYMSLSGPRTIVDFKCMRCCIIKRGTILGFDSNKYEYIP